MAFLFVPRPGVVQLLARFGPLRLRVAAVAGDIEEEAKARVNVKTGATRDSGRVEATSDGSRVLFGGAAKYLEFGAYGRSYPFLRPAGDAVVPGGRRGS